MDVDSNAFFVCRYGVFGFWEQPHLPQPPRKSTLVRAPFFFFVHGPYERVRECTYSISPYARRVVARSPYFLSSIPVRAPSLSRQRLKRLLLVVDEKVIILNKFIWADSKTFGIYQLEGRVYPRRVK